MVEPKSGTEKTCGKLYHLPESGKCGAVITSKTLLKDRAPRFPRASIRQYDGRPAS